MRGIDFRSGACPVDETPGGSLIAYDGYTGTSDWHWQPVFVDPSTLQATPTPFTCPAPNACYVFGFAVDPN